MQKNYLKPMLTFKIKLIIPIPNSNKFWCDVDRDEMKFVNLHYYTHCNFLFFLFTLSHNRIPATTSTGWKWRENKE